MTVFLNIVLWDKHASLTGTFFLLLCLAGGAFYQQAPLRIQAYQIVIVNESEKVVEDDIGGSKKNHTNESLPTKG